MRADAIARLRSDPIDWRYKGFPPAEGVTPANVASRGWNLLRGDLFLPAVVIKESALANNLALMRRWCDRHGVLLAPHGKTTMSPELFARQLDAGCWGITAATPSQMRVYRHFGVQRIILANELVEPASVRWLAAELADDPDFDAYCLVDSIAAVERMETALAAQSVARLIPVLVELGVAGGRTGTRTVEGAIAVADAVLRSPVLRFAGVECYEGVLDQPARIEALLNELAGLVRRLGESASFDHSGEMIISAGGSEAFDKVVDYLAVDFGGLRTKLVLRSGCYLTHDDGVYEERSPLGAHRAGHDHDHLVPALEAWGVVLSRPEPELALVCMGKRDVSFDDEFPIPLKVRSLSGAIRAVKGTMTVSNLNDQHAFIRLSSDDPLEVGDLLCCGISHPCTTFDKWRLIPVVDDDYAVIDAVHTFF